ncbi:MAG: hypothetical protein K2Q18_01090, partial [Bdellovibrionales bacterium]|nr:hypothetical protein [Bdellovibrionales bacterium]
MKITLNLLFILITSLALQGCVADSSGAKNKTKSSSKSTTTTPTAPTFSSDEILYWYTTSKITGAATVNLNTSSVIYLRGKTVHNFLSTVSGTYSFYQGQYCIVGNFGTSFRQLRVRAVPMTMTSSNKAIERVLRIDLPSSEENTATCGYTAIDGLDPVTVSPDKTVALSIGALCPASGCLGTLVSSTSLKFYSSSTSVLSPVSQLNLTSMFLKVDVQSNSTAPETSCSNSACTAKGFDCCSDGQCVMDASLKSNASGSADYAQAMSDYNANPLSFINYPQIFNVCSNIAHTPPTTTNPGNTPLTDAQKRVAAYLDDYKCIDQVLSVGTYTLCLPGKTTSDYNSIKKKLAISCGCPANYTDSEIIAKCPDWGIRPLYSSATQTVNNIVDFYCFTPTPENPAGTITNLNVTVPNRSAPHRFYSTTGANFDDPSKQPSSVIQEGDDFYYQDDVNKASPVNGKYNMNSVLGRMNVAMSNTQPAKQVTVE